MTSIQLLLAICVPSFTVLVGILLNNRALADNTRVLTEFKGDTNRRLERIENDLREFYKVTGRLEGKVEALERKA